MVPWERSSPFGAATRSSRPDPGQDCWAFEGLLGLAVMVALVGRVPCRSLSSSSQALSHPALKEAPMSHPRFDANFAANNDTRQQRIYELRHRLRYAQNDQERIQVRNELDFWMRHQR